MMSKKSEIGFIIKTAILADIAFRQIHGNTPKKAFSPKVPRLHNPIVLGNKQEI